MLIISIMRVVLEGQKLDKEVVDAEEVERYK